MSQTTRDWLLAKYVKATNAIHDMKTALDAMTTNYRNEAEENAELHTRVAHLEGELGKYRGYGEVQERLESMSVGAHVEVHVKDGSSLRPLILDSVRTSNGVTTIRGHL